MKRLSTLIVLSLGIVFLAASCGPEKEEWERFYGYTKADVLGHYDANPDESLYEELPTIGVQVYPNATIDITEYGENLVNVRIVIPEVFYKNFRGQVAINEDDSEIAIGDTDGSDILITVYRNAQNQVRMHGRARQRKIWTQPVVSYDYIIYGFDVIKAEQTPTK